MAGFDADCQRGMNEAGERHKELLAHRQEIARLEAELKKAYGRITALSLKEGRIKIADVFQQQQDIIHRFQAELAEARKKPPAAYIQPTDVEIQSYISAWDGDISEKEARYLLEINFWKSKARVPEPGVFTKKNRLQIQRDALGAVTVINMSKESILIIAKEALKHLGEACDIIDRNENLRNWLIKIRQSKEIMETRRFAEEALKGE